jgi:hypothetical protein
LISSENAKERMPSIWLPVSYADQPGGRRRKLQRKTDIQVFAFQVDFSSTARSFNYSLGAQFLSEQYRGQ